MANITQVSADFSRSIAPTVAPAQFGGKGTLGTTYFSSGLYAPGPPLPMVSERASNYSKTTTPVHGGGGWARPHPPMMGPSNVVNPTPGTGGGTFVQPSYPGIQMATQHGGLYTSPTGVQGSFNAGGGQPADDIFKGTNGGVFVSGHGVVSGDGLQGGNYPQVVGNVVQPGGGVFVSGTGQADGGHAGSGASIVPPDMTMGGTTGGVFVSGYGPNHRSGVPGSGLHPVHYGQQHVGSGPGSTYFTSTQHGGLYTSPNPYLPGAPAGAFRGGGGNPPRSIEKVFVSAEPTNTPKMPITSHKYAKYMHKGTQHAGPGGIYFTSGHGIPGQGGDYPQREGTPTQPGGGVFVSGWPDDLVGYRHNAPVKVGGGNVYSLGSVNPSFHSDTSFHVPHPGTESGVYGVSAVNRPSSVNNPSFEDILVWGLMFGLGAFASALSMTKKPHRALVSEGVKHIRGIRGLTSSQRAAEQEAEELERENRSGSGFLSRITG